SSSSLFLIPDICKVLPIPMELYRLAYLMPSLIQRLDRYLIVNQFKNRMNLPISHNQTLFSAFCSCSAHEGSNYERLENLGDSFIKFAVSIDIFRKYPNLDEGGMTYHRGKIICNKNLYEISIKKNFDSLMFVNAFNPKSWYPPKHKKKSKKSDSSISLYQSTKGPLWRVISKKTLADFIESLTAAYYVESGLNTAIKFCHMIGLISENTNQCFKTSHNNLGLNEESLDKLRLAQSKLHYHFKNRLYLVEAFTHASYTTVITHNYERLEFLGDATLDWILQRFFFLTYPSASAAELSELRQAAVNNESLARLSIGLGYHYYLMHHSVNLQNEITMYIDMLEKKKTIRPKVLGDLFEAVIGAVLVDSNYNVTTVWRVFRPLLSDFLDKHAS
ncbi:ribonuclease III, partial [Neocallimastix californiae]